MDDPEVARMLADLGNARRDEVSAPAERNSCSSYEERRVLSNAAERRRQNLATDSKSIRAWNTVEIFGGDQVAEQLVDRFSGQGHRAGLTSRVHQRYDDGHEKLENRVGEERRLYLQDKEAANRGSYIASAVATLRHDHSEINQTPRDMNGGGGGGGGTRTSSSQGHKGQFNPDSVRAGARARAPDPRASGTIRFVGGQRINDLEGSARDEAPRAHPDLPVTAIGNNTENLVPGDRSGQPGTSDQKDHVLEEQLKQKALWDAANLTPGCNDYDKMDSTRLRYLAWARELIVAEVTELAKNPQGSSAIAYLETHKDRRWMFEAAIRVKEVVVSGVDAEQWHRTAPVKIRGFKMFLAAAKKAHGPEPPPPPPTQNQVSIPAAIPRPALSQSPSPKSSSPPNDTNAASQHMPPESAKHSSTSSLSSMSSATAASEPPSRPTGTLVATFLDFSGRFLGQKILSIDTPSTLSLTVRPNSVDFDPLELISTVGGIAKVLVDRSRGMEGVVKEDGGLWVEG